MCVFMLKGVAVCSVLNTNRKLLTVQCVTCNQWAICQDQDCVCDFILDIVLHLLL